MILERIWRVILQRIWRVILRMLLWVILEMTVEMTLMKPEKIAEGKLQVLVQVMLQQWL